MRILCYPAALLASATAIAAAAPGFSPSRWHSDGARSCQFDANVSPVSCTQYDQALQRHAKGGGDWTEYSYMWKGPRGLAVRYSPRLGLIGVSDFTIGDLVDPSSKLIGHASKNAVSYAPSRKELIIGVPGEGYEFSVTGGSP